MKYALKLIMIVASVLLFLSPFALAQDQESKKDELLTKKKKEEIIIRVATELRDKYVFSNVGDKMANFIEKNLQYGKYDSFDVPGKFTAQLEKDAQSISKDSHVKIRPGEAPTNFDDLNILKKENFGFRDVEILQGNIGFLSFYQFYDPKLAAPTAIAALNYLAHCDALIIDLRANGGGRPEMKQLMCSYFFDDPVCLLEFYNSKGLESQQFSFKEVSGPKILDVPIYILTSRNTFSGAEGFTFSMQNLGRAIVIGENTRGGAHDGELFTFSKESIFMQIPLREARDPITKETWEGVGIQPDIVVPQEDAKLVAVIEATKTLLKNKNPDEEWKQLWEWVKKDYESKLNPSQTTVNDLQKYVGEYGNYKVSFENGQLYFRFTTKPKSRFVQVDTDLFKPVFDDDMMNGFSRIKFTRNDSGDIEGLRYQNINGYLGRVHNKN